MTLGELLTVMGITKPELVCHRCRASVEKIMSQTGPRKIETLRVWITNEEQIHGVLE